MKRMFNRPAWFIAAMVLFSVCAAGARAQSAATHRFDSDQALRGWEVRGDVAIDHDRVREGETGSLRIAPGGAAILKLSDQSRSGRVSIWVYDDGQRPANARAKRPGPRWGVMQPDGSTLVVGHLYAHYLNGAETYAAAEAKLTDKPAAWLNRVQYLGVKRKPDGWQEWTFDFDPEAGFTLSVNGKPIKRFDWNKTQAHGMSGVVLLGDPIAKDGQTLWVGPVRASTGAAMKTRPVPPPPPPPVVPDADPAPSRKVQLLEPLRGVHPRVLFTAEDIDELRRRYEQDPIAREKIERYLKSSNPFTEAKFLKDATDGQRVGLWRIPTVVLHYAVTGDPQSRDKGIEFLRRLVALESWETTRERDSGMSAGNIMIGAALAYDVLYHDLPPDLREQAADKLIRQARAMIHGGHLKKNPGAHYWQNDPANNHRWHRNAGLAMCLLAAYEGQPEAQWAMEFLQDELAYIHQWLPEDGTNHEGPGYLVFGLPHLVLAMHASDHALGTDYLQHPYFGQAPWFQAHAMRPGLREFMPYGDTGGGLGFYWGALYAGASAQRDAEAIVALDRIRAINPKAFNYGWMDLLWRDGSLVQPDTSYSLPVVGRYEDLGITFIRDGWGDDAVAAMFKCGPLGGFELNAFRESQDPFGYINVAHCDPDANSFIISIGDKLIAETSRYSHRKLSSSHNTILVNGTGQYAPGRREGGVWSQPATGNHSMLEDARVIAWDRQADGTLIIEGEAAGSYPANNKTGRPQIDRFRRLFVWKEGQYILILDDVRSPEPVTITWLTQSPQLQPAGQGRYALINQDARCGFQLASTAPLTATIGESTADNKKKPLGWRQLQASTEPVEAVQFAGVYMPWGGEPEVMLQPEADHAVVTVRHGRGEDRWIWRFAEGPDQPAALTLDRAAD